MTYTSLSTMTGTALSSDPADANAAAERDVHAAPECRPEQQPDLSPEANGEPTRRGPATRRIGGFPLKAAVLLVLAFLAPTLIPKLVAALLLGRSRVMGSDLARKVALRG